MRYSNDDICDPAVRTHLEQLMEEAHHALCSFATVSLHCGKLGGQEVIKLLLKRGELQYWAILSSSLLFIKLKYNLCLYP